MYALFAEGMGKYDIEEYVLCSADIQKIIGLVEEHFDLCVNGVISDLIIHGESNDLLLVRCKKILSST